jgi:hypothetical protein
VKFVDRPIAERRDMTIASIISLRRRSSSSGGHRREAALKTLQALL